MLKKLISYEFRATRRFMHLIYGALIILSALMALGIKGRLFDAIEALDGSFYPGGMLLFVLAFSVISLFVIMIVAVSTATFFYGIKRFHDNILGNEGYLMHTLPVKTRDLLLSKTIVCTVWSIVSVLIVMLSYTLIILSIDNLMVLKSVQEELYSLCRELGAIQMVLFCMEGLVAVVIACAQNYLHIYAAMSMGYARNTKRVFFSLIYYVLFNIAFSFVSNILSFPIYMILKNQTGVNIAHLFLLGYILFTAVVSWVFYAIAHHYLRNKLNLQ